ncbi:hypothetical protein Lal_00023838 [Lupinus albus]|nr:hypothetical protein Lal_00023838 [Lupinus albus]
MDQLYFDGMAICSSLGFPDFFLTMTCNPNWHEIVRFLNPMGLKSYDRSYIISRVSKMKFEELLQDLKKKHVLGKVIAYMYTIEFQKRGLVLTNEELQNLTLLEIEKILEGNRRSLKDYPSMPYPNGYVSCHLGNRLIYEELNHDTDELKKNFNTLFNSLTSEQYTIFHTIMEVVNRQQGLMFFLYGYGGTRKTHIRGASLVALHSSHTPVIMELPGRSLVQQVVSEPMVRLGHDGLKGERTGKNYEFLTSSGIASLLLPGGRTTHSKFKIHVPTFDNSVCNIHQGTELAELLKQTKLII